MDFLIKRSSPLEKFFLAYCNRFGLQPAQVRFTLKNRDEISPKDSAEKLGLQDRDQIYVELLGPDLQGAWICGTCEEKTYVRAGVTCSCELAHESDKQLQASSSTAMPAEEVKINFGSPESDGGTAGASPFNFPPACCPWNWGLCERCTEYAELRTCRFCLKHYCDLCGNARVGFCNPCRHWHYGPLDDPEAAIAGDIATPDGHESPGEAPGETRYIVEVLWRGWGANDGVGCFGGTPVFGECQCCGLEDCLRVCKKCCRTFCHRCGDISPGWCFRCHA